MAFRISESVVRGEIDNRVKGVVHGRIWLQDRPEPVTLELKGNAHPDLAGCFLTFINRSERIVYSELDSLAAVQRGVVGDITAARKVRIWEEADESDATFVPSSRGPEQFANALYLEWFSESNGRVVIESAEYNLTVSAPVWHMTAEENEQRAGEVSAAMKEFLDRLTNAIEQHQLGRKDPEEPWDEHDYERLFRESDARTDKYIELLDKYGDSDEAEEKIAREMGWERELSEEEAEEERRRVEEINRACEEALNEPPPEPEPHREGIDWIRTKDGDLRHPLQHRCFESAVRFWRESEALESGKVDDKELDRFLSEFQTTSVKLGGALNGIAQGYDQRDGAFTVAYLKRALDHLHKAQAGLEAVAPKNLLPAEMVASARQELFEIRESIIQLMDEFRREP